MSKLQVHLPKPLYKKLKEISKRMDYSMAELIRRGAEQIVIYYSHLDENDKRWAPPKPRKLGMKNIPHEKLRSMAYES